MHIFIGCLLKNIYSFYDLMGNKIKLTIILIIYENLKLMFKDFICGHDNPDESGNQKVPDGPYTYELRGHTARHGFYLSQHFLISSSQPGPYVLVTH